MPLCKVSSTVPATGDCGFDFHPCSFANSGMSFNGTPVRLALLLHGEITFNLLIVRLKVPLRTAFPSFPKRIEIFFFCLTQPSPRTGIRSTAALTAGFRLPGDYQLPVKSSQECGSTSDEGHHWSAAARASTREPHMGALDPIALADLVGSV